MWKTYIYPQYAQTFPQGFPAGKVFFSRDFCALSTAPRISPQILDKGRGKAPSEHRACIQRGVAAHTGTKFKVRLRRDHRTVVAAQLLFGQIQTDVGVLSAVVLKRGTNVGVGRNTACNDKLGLARTAQCRIELLCDRGHDRLRERSGNVGGVVRQILLRQRIEMVDDRRLQSREREIERVVGDRG